VANTLAYYDTAKITAVNIFIVKAPDVLTRVTIGKYAAGLVHYDRCTNFAQSLLKRL
jgi:hypothetical protein